MQQHGIWCSLASTEGGRWAGVLGSAPGRPSRRPPGRGSLWAAHCSLGREAPVINPQNLFFAQMNNNEIKETCATGSKLGNNPWWVIPETESRLNSSAASDRKEKTAHISWEGKSDWKQANRERHKLLWISHTVEVDTGPGLWEMRLAKYEGVVKLLAFF